MKMIMDGLGPTLLLTLSAVIVACLISLPLGIQSARFQNKGWDNSSSVFSFLATSTPSFFLALIFLYLFAVKLKWLPIGGMYDSGKPETPSLSVKAPAYAGRSSGDADGGEPDSVYPEQHARSYA